MVSLDDEGVASYTFHFNDTANFGWQVDDLPDAGGDDWLHIASLSCVVSPGAEVLLDWMRAVPCGVSYDINVRPTVITDPDEYWAKVQPWLRVLGQRGGIVKASDEDIKFLAQAAGGSGLPRGVRTRSTVAAGWVEQYGLGLAVITLGPGAGRQWSRVARRPGSPAFRPRWSTRSGAGDTFMAGFLDGPGQARDWTWSVPAARGRRRVDRLLPARGAAADLGRGGRPDRDRLSFPHLGTDSSGTRLLSVDGHSGSHRRSRQGSAAGGCRPRSDAAATADRRRHHRPEPESHRSP